MGWTIEELEELEIKSTEKPRLVTRGPQTPITPPTIENIVINDYLSFTSEETSSILKEFMEIVLPGVTFTPRNTGLFGYKRSIDIVFNCQTIGKIAYIMKDQPRNLLSLTGQGCKRIENWSLFQYWVEKLQSPRITRIDHALDFFDGTVTDETIMNAYNNGGFKLPMARQNPQISTIKSENGDGQNLGITRMIGSKNSRKYARCYQKGFEQMSKTQHFENFDFFFSLFLDGICKYNNEDQVLKGEEFRDWYRVEIQNMNRDCELPIDMITLRDEYFSTSFPYCSEIIKKESYMKTKRRTPKPIEVDLFKSLDSCINQYGNTFADILLLSGKTKEELIDYIFYRHNKDLERKEPKIRMSPSQKLLQSGEYVKS